MRRLMLLAAVTLAGCGAPTGPVPSTPSPKAPLARPGPRVRARDRRPPPRRQPRPKRWVAQRVGRVKVTAGGAGQVDDLVAVYDGLVVAAVRERGEVGSWLKAWATKTRTLYWKLRAPARRVELGRSANRMSLLVTTPAGTNHVYVLSDSKPVRHRKWKRKRGRNKGRSQGLSAGGRMLIRGDVRGQIRGYELKTYKMKWLIKGEQVVLSNDGLVAAVIQSRQVRLLNALTGSQLGKPIALGRTLLALAGHSKKLWARWVRQGQSCAVIVTGRKPARVACLTSPQLLFSPSGKLVGLAGKGAALVVRVADGKVMSRHKSLASTPLKVAFLKDGSYVVANETVGQLSFYRLVKR